MGAETRAGQLSQASRSARASVNMCAMARARSTSSPFRRARRTLLVWAFRTSFAVRACRQRRLAGYLAHRVDRLERHCLIARLRALL